MMKALIAAAQSEPSKTFYYVAGAALAVWAVVLSAIGLTRPDFPGSGGAARAAMGVTAALAVCVMVAAVITS